MAWISARTVVQSHSLYLLILAYFLLRAPQWIQSQNIVFILGEAMGMPKATHYDEPSALSAFVAVLCAVLAVNDLVATTTMPEEVESYYWSNQALVRVLAFFGFTAYLYVSKGTKGALGVEAGNVLKNDVMFTWAAVEMFTWFLVSSGSVSRIVLWWDEGKFPLE
ncbi:MAG: hypothetical protein M1816_005784 [Peltula sp. TS41687]|nr:MAG: hypothetical protein M1816_005784 [Peltula sp. TS41687]